MVSPIWSVVAEIDEARLVGMECESIPCKALTQNAKDPLGIEEVLERQHGIVGEADKGTSPLETWIDDVVQRRQRHSSFRSCQFSYPLSFRGQVCETQGPLPCFSSTVLFSSHPSSLDRVPVSPVPRRLRSY